MQTSNCHDNERIVGALRPLVNEPIDPRHIGLPSIFPPRHRRQNVCRSFGLPQTDHFGYQELSVARLFYES